MEHLIKEYRSFRIYVIQATSQKGARVRIIDEMLQNRKSIPYDYQIGNYIKMGIAYLYGKGIVVKGIVTKRNEILLLSDDLSKGL